MKKMVAVAMLLMLLFTTCLAATAAAPKVSTYTMTSQMATINSVGIDGIREFQWLIRDEDLAKVKYQVIKIDKYNGAFLVANQDGVIGRFWPDKEIGQSILDTKKLANVSEVFTKEGTVKDKFAMLGYSVVGHEFYSEELKPIMVVELDGEDHYRLVVVKEGFKLPSPTPEPTATPKPTKEPTKEPTATPRVTPHPQITDTSVTATPKPTPKPELEEPTVTATPKVTPAPHIEDVVTPKPEGKVTPRPVVTDPNPTLSPEDDGKLDFEDIPFVPDPTKTPSGKTTPRPVIVDPNPTLSPEDDAKLDFVDIPVSGTPVPTPKVTPMPATTEAPEHKVTPAPQVVEKTAEPTKRPMPQPGLKDDNPVIDSEGSGLDF